MCISFCYYFCSIFLFLLGGGRREITFEGEQIQKLYKDKLETLLTYKELIQSVFKIEWHIYRILGICVNTIEHIPTCNVSIRISVSTYLSVSAYMLICNSFWGYNRYISCSCLSEHFDFLHESGMSRFLADGVTCIFVYKVSSYSWCTIIMDTGRSLLSHIWVNLEATWWISWLPNILFLLQLCTSTLALHGYRTWICMDFTIK